MVWRSTLAILGLQIAPARNDNKSLLSNIDKMNNKKSDLEIIPCNICQSTAHETIYIKGGMAIVQCKNCGLIFVNPRLTQEATWQRYSPDYFWDE